MAARRASPGPTAKGHSPHQGWLHSFQPSAIPLAGWFTADEGTIVIAATFAPAMMPLTSKPRDVWRIAGPTPLVMEVVPGPGKDQLSLRIALYASPTATNPQATVRVLDLGLAVASAFDFTAAITFAPMIGAGTSLDWKAVVRRGDVLGILTTSSTAPISPPGAADQLELAPRVGLAAAPCRLCAFSFRDTHASVDQLRALAST